MSIFQDSSGSPIKFFLQKDVPDQDALCELIMSLGGRVEEKIPRSGFVLLVPGTQEAERLRLCWEKNQERPDRHFVPYTFVEACRAAGSLLKQIFVENGEPIKFYIDSSIANINVRTALSARIAHSGGDPNASAQTARVILADPNTDDFQQLIKKFQGASDKYVESHQWVKKCIEKGQVTYTPVVYKNPGGRRAGEERTQFSVEDEMRLCHWIAEKIPYKETGGRTGNRLYMQLVEKAGDPEYAWVSRHTWQSWRERYKKNAPRLDAAISQIVSERKPVLGEKGQYGYVRKPEEKLPVRRRRRKESISAPVVHSDDERIVQSNARPSDPRLQPVPINVQSDTISQHGLAHLHSMPPIYPPGVVPPPHLLSTHVEGLAALGGGPMDPPLPSTTVAINNDMPLQRNDSAESDPEWSIKDGNHTQPEWAKRKSTDAQEGLGAHKRQKLSVEGTIHVVDQTIQEIAREYRFTITEVQEYYDKCGEMDRTRSRFKKMRETIDNIDAD